MRSYLERAETDVPHLSAEMKDKLLKFKLKHKMFVATSVVDILNLKFEEIDPTFSTSDLSDSDISDLGISYSHHRSIRVKRQAVSRQTSNSSSIATQAMINSALFFYHKAVSIAIAQERRGLLSPASKDTLRRLLDIQVSTLNEKLTQILGNR